MSKLFSFLALGAALSALLLLDRQKRPPSRARAAASGRSWDEYLTGRLRAKLPQSIQVGVHNAAATLRGSVRYDERDRLLVAALSIPGIERVINLLETEGRPADIG